MEKQIPDNSARKRYAYYIGVAVVLVLFAIFIHFRSPNIPDSDSFYHIRHALHYYQDGLFNTSFPWLPYSPVAVHHGDIWWGFHIFLVPFVALFAPVLAIKIAGVAIALLLIAMLWWVGARHGLGVLAPAVPLVAYLSATNVTFHLGMTRPHVLTTGISVLLFSFLMQGGLVAIALAAFFVAFLHASFFWLVILITLGSAFFLFIGKQPWFKKLCASFIGLILGLFSRPNPIGAFHVVKVQIFDLLREKLAGTPLNFGKELFPLDATTFFYNFSLFAIVLVAALFFATRAGIFKQAQLSQKKRILLLGSLFFTTVFMLMTLFLARRFYDMWAAFGALFILLSVKAFLDTQKDSTIRKNIFAGVGAAVLLLGVIALPRHGASLATANNPETFHPVANWLVKNTSAGDIVYNIYWDSFPKLVFWDAKNRYVSGMDPIFLFTYNRTLYWYSYYLNTGDLTDKSCGAPACTAEMLRDTHDVLVNDFKARYIFIEKARSAKFADYVASDKRYIKRYEDKDFLIYEL